MSLQLSDKFSLPKDAVLWTFAFLAIRGAGKTYDAAKLAEQILKQDRKSTRLNSSHLVISYAVFCLKKKKESNAPGDCLQDRRGVGLLEQESTHRIDDHRDPVMIDQGVQPDRHALCRLKRATGGSS